jgi:hypothetical protein
MLEGVIAILVVLRELTHHINMNTKPSATVAFVTFALCGIFGLLWAASALADEDPDERGTSKPEGAENCVSLAAIRKTRIVDDQTIIFYMRGDNIFINRLPRKCNGLKRGDGYSYETSLTQLCNTDIIRVLQRFGGALPRPQNACGLGFFQPTTAEAVDLLINEPPEVDPEAAEPELEAPEPESSEPDEQDD